MHILYLTAADTKYGEAKALSQMISEIKQIDAQIEISVILMRNSSMVAKFEEMGCRVYVVNYRPYIEGKPKEKWKLPIKYILYYPQYRYQLIKAERKVSKLIDFSKIDLIHSNSSREDLGATLAEKYSLPLLWHLREFGDSYGNCFSLRRNYIKRMNQTTTKLIAVSDAVRMHWVNKGIFLDKIKTIYDGVCPYENVKARNHTPGEIHLIMIGDIGDVKGQYFLIDAICKMRKELQKKVFVDFAGDGNNSYRQRMQNRIDESGLSLQIRFLGYQKNMGQKLSGYDCGVVCTRAEGFGLATAEYMVAGMPVIASDSGANPELITDGVNGLLWHYGDTYDLAKKIEYFLQNPIALSTMGAEAYKIVNARFTARINAENIYREYCEIINKL